MKLTVAEKQQLTRQIWQFTFTADEFMPWAPGAHIALTLPSGLVRQYSLCGPVANNCYVIAVLNEEAGRGGSRELVNEVDVGTELCADPPVNTFGFEPTTSQVLFVAGGIGITPIMSMIRAAEQRELRWALHYCGRSQDELAFLDGLTQAYGPERIITHISSEHSRLRLPEFVRDAVLHECEVYACGPVRMLDELTALGVELSTERVHVERFSAIEVSADDAESFTVEIASSGLEYEIPSDKSILEVLEHGGEFVLSSCREGTCGTCETGVLEGEIDHRDSVLSPPERADNDRMMICVSRACKGCTRLLLDL